jgi:hypothetical protein
VAIWETFSKRKRKLAGTVPDVYQYDQNLDTRKVVTDKSGPLCNGLVETPQTMNWKYARRPLSCKFLTHIFVETGLPVIADRQSSITSSRLFLNRLWAMVCLGGRRPTPERTGIGSISMKLHHPVEEFAHGRRLLVEA